MAREQRELDERPPFNIESVAGLASGSCWAEYHARIKELQGEVEQARAEVAEAEADVSATPGSASAICTRRRFLASLAFWRRFMASLASRRRFCLWNF